ncbi:AAA family ATPase [Acidovorax sp.]|uniref:AAA family ATPase n=1 Tax=Acidovorax sp. TaxID=1872122 RepID=UPI00391B4019
MPVRNSIAAHINLASLELENFLSRPVLEILLFTPTHLTKVGQMPLSEIRDSTKTQLLEKVRRHDYGMYLLKANIGRIRGFVGEDITFDFPVTALIGPNGSGKSAVLRKLFTNRFWQCRSDARTKTALAFEN